MAASVVFGGEAGSQERDLTLSETTNVGHSAGDVVNVLGESTHCSPGISRKLTSPWSRKGKSSGDFDVLRASVLRGDFCVSLPRKLA